MKKTNYAVEAQRFLDAVGGKDNVQSYLHCVTRLRFNVIDKEKVDIKAIKESPIAKGTNWTQNQLQIILGTGVVESVYTQLEKIYNYSEKIESNKSNNNESFEDFKLKAKANKEAIRNKGGKFAWIQLSMKTLGDIFLPIIPAIVAAGLAMGVAATIQMLVKYDSDSLLGKILDIITKTAFSSLAVLVCWSTVKRFGGSPVIGIIIGLMLISPLLPDKGSIATWEAQEQFRESFDATKWGTSDWKQVWKDATGLSVLENPVTPIKLWIIPITGYQGSVLPALVIGIGAAYLEKWIKSWMPNAVNIIFTPFLTIVISLLVALFAFGPILLMVEKGILIATQAILKLPVGIGTALIAGALQAIVITGCHQILQGLEMQLVIQGNVPDSNGAISGSIFNSLWTASIISQGGAAMAVAFKAKSKKEKNLSIPSAASTFFGITEPAIFGVNLPRVKPFIFGLVGGFAGGLFAGIFNVTCRGMGVTVLPGLLLYTNNIRNLLLIIVVNLLSFGVAFALTFFLYFEAGKKVTQKNLDKFKIKIDQFKEKLSNFKSNLQVKDYENKLKRLENGLVRLNKKEEKLNKNKEKYDNFLVELKETREREKQEQIKLKEDKKKHKEMILNLKKDPEKWKAYKQDIKKKNS
ncbi:PTS transporter subunit EIIC [Spiroplasma turonicum]|uniref:PTS system sucrose-specific IIABC component n=1 Tax=Spiroplasma turonicum TaxID=216946 RepID=A0A0K1P604_9MOLU|nr:PTS transporter subunit EIIC [Spiroplasma turonicum]AKU79695.1 PTS system sucrose-specific IIABC component [Spiroplasma turonicum]ALX70713.1 PTS system, sucrose-specific IIB component [Spiroplasma turonicum]